MKSKKQPVNGSALPLSELHKHCSEFKTLQLTIANRTYETRFRVPTGIEIQKAQDLADAVLPPVIRGTTPDQDRINYLEVDYVKKRNDATAKGRSLLVYWCMPDVQAMNPGLTDFDAINEFVMNTFTAEVLIEFQRVLNEPIVNLAEIINFT